MFGFGRERCHDCDSVLSEKIGYRKHEVETTEGKIVVCEDCYNLSYKGQIENYENEKKIMNSMKFVYEEWHTLEAEEIKKPVYFYVRIYSDKKLTDEERHSESKTKQHMLTTLYFTGRKSDKKRLISAKEGERILTGQGVIQDINGNPNKKLFYVITKSGKPPTF